MKKTLLMAAAMMAVSMAGNAQQTAKFQGFSPVKAKAQVKHQATASNMQRDAANGVYYTRPTGSLVAAFANHSYYNFYSTMVVVPPFQDVLFNNLCNDKAAAKWYFGDTYVDPEKYPGNFDENNNFKFNCSAGSLPDDKDPAGTYATYLPVIEVGFNQYCFGEEKSDYDPVEYPSLLATRSELSTLGIFDLAVGIGLAQYDYPYGTVSFEGEDAVDVDNDGNLENADMTGVYQMFDKPVSPLYIESVDVLSLTLNSEGKFIQGDGKLTLTFRDVYVDDEGRKQVGAKVLGTMTADASTVYDEVLELGQGYMGGCVNFADKRTDEFGLEYLQPITLDQEFCVCIDGFQNEGVNMGFPIVRTNEDYYPITYFTMAKQGESESHYSYYCYEDGIMPLGFNAMFDVADVQSTLYDENSNEMENMNVLRVSADGQTCNVDGYEGIPGAYVYTARPWTTDGNENYSIVSADLDAYPWIESLVVDESSWVSQSGNGLNIVGVRCAPLSGSTGRQAVIHLQGRGIVSAPIIVCQGDITPDGIDAVDADKKDTANGAAYNLNGQRVNENAKGIIVKDGKKFMNK